MGSTMGANERQTRNKLSNVILSTCVNDSNHTPILRHPHDPKLKQRLVISARAGDQKLILWHRATLPRCTANPALGSHKMPLGQ